MLKQFKNKQTKKKKCIQAKKNYKFVVEKKYIIYISTYCFHFPHCVKKTKPYCANNALYIPKYIILYIAKWEINQKQQTHKQRIYICNQQQGSCICVLLYMFFFISPCLYLFNTIFFLAIYRQCIYSIYPYCIYLMLYMYTLTS